ncbi:5-hydroxytryptamine receptor 1D-like [Clytia hemisphaerica]|uniref:5-hydroxytryptamine receptor 1D-like n=1 Tax=Clytia hemisphaerica TaxID=252671 RepID=UPI0034D6DD82
MNITQRMYCVQVMDDIEEAPRKVRIFLTIPFILLGVIGVLSNTLVIWLVTKTRQLSNQSTRLIFILSFYDLFHSVIANTGHALYIGQSENLPCIAKGVILIMNIFLVSSQFTLITVIAFDRLMRVLWIQEYSTKFNANRFKIALVIQSTIVLVITIIWIFGLSVKYPDKALSMTNPINSFIYVLTTVFYLISIYKLRMAQRNNNVFRGTRKLTRMASIYIAIYLFTNIPLLVASHILKKMVLLKSDELWFASIHMFGSLLLLNINGIFNAVAFLAKNRQCRRLLRQYYRRLSSFIFRHRSQIEAEQRVPIPQIQEVPIRDEPG